jgi:hypothetical protein
MIVSIQMCELASAEDQRRSKKSEGPCLAHKDVAESGCVERWYGAAIGTREWACLSCGVSDASHGYSIYPKEVREKRRS